MAGLLYLEALAWADISFHAFVSPRKTENKPSPHFNRRPVGVCRCVSTSFDVDQHKGSRLDLHQPRNRWLFCGYDASGGSCSPGLSPSTLSVPEPANGTQTPPGADRGVGRGHVIQTLITTGLQPPASSCYWSVAAAPKNSGTFSFAFAAPAAPHSLAAYSFELIHSHSHGKDLWLMELGTRRAAFVLFSTVKETKSD